jgi:hypothetical protein
MEYKTFNPADKITLDVPLFIRLLEYAREDAKTDMDLHKVTENAVALSETGKTLTMDQYDAIVKDGGQEDASYANMANENQRMQELAGIKEEKYPWKIEITSKKGSVTTHVVPTHDSTELHKIVSKLKQSKGVKDVKILD